MKSEVPKVTDDNDEQARRGWILYDAECGMCTGLVIRTGAALRARGFDHAPLQEAWVQQRLGLTRGQLLAEMRVLTLDGRTLGGADAIVYLASQIYPSHPPWWAWLLRLVSKMPLGLRLLRYGYRWVAAQRNCRQGTCVVGRSGKISEEGSMNPAPYERTLPPVPRV